MSKCQYIDTCPAATGWCNNMKPDANCLGMVLRHYQMIKNQKGVLLVKLNCFVNLKDSEQLREDIINQIKTGVVVLPPICNAEYVPPDVVVKIQES